MAKIQKCCRGLVRARAVVCIFVMAKCTLYIIEEHLCYIAFVLTVKSE